MTNPTFSPEQMNSLLTQAGDLFNKVQDSKISAPQDMTDEIETNLADAKYNYSTAGPLLADAQKKYTINKYGKSYYTQTQNEESTQQLKNNVQDNIDYFLLALNSSEKELDLLNTNIHQLNLIKKLFSTNSDTLNDIFGFDISPFEFNEFNMNTQEGFETAVVNRQIYYENNRISNIDMVNKILFVIYYILCIIFIVLYKSTVIIKIVVGSFFIIFPFLNIFVAIFVFFYNIIKIISRFLF